MLPGFSATLGHGMTVLLVVFLVLTSAHALLLMLALPELWSHWTRSDDAYVRALVGPDALPPVSVVAAMYNAGATAADAAAMLLAFDYPRYDVILVNDGSTDDTMTRWCTALELYEVPPAFTVELRTAPVHAYYRSRLHPRLLCIDKVHGGVADALNAGINAARSPYTLAVGPHVMLEPNALFRLTRPFVFGRSVAAVAPAPRVSNDGQFVKGRFIPAVSRRLLVGLQTAEYLRTHLFERLGWNRVASNLVFPENVAMVRREDLRAVGGFRGDVEGPAVDLVVRLHRSLTDRGMNPWTPVVPDAVAWCRVPNTRAAFAAVRGRKHRGLVQALRDGRRMFLNPEYGVFGALVMPFVWLSEVVAPFLELGGYIGLIIGSVIGVLSAGFVWAYLATVLGYSMLLSVWAVGLEALTVRRYTRRADVARLAAYAILESAGYRQYLAWVRIRSLFRSYE